MRLTLGEMIDKLTIVNVKCFMQIDIHADKTKTNEERLEAADKVRQLNSDRNILIKEIDQYLEDAIAGKLCVRLSNIKMYKDGLQG